jgi:lipoyl(octanoyl) transferase
MHGFALNVNLDQSYFDHIVPCGLPGAKVTTMENEMSTNITISEVLPILVNQFGINFGWTMKKQEKLI